MMLNYVLMACTAIYSIAGIIFWKTGRASIKPITTIFAILLFILALVATCMGITYTELRYMIEGVAQ